MLTKMFSIYDVKAQAYMQPFFYTTKGLAIRAVTDTVSRGDTQFSKYPDDFVLFYHGEFDDATGKIEALEKPELVGSIAELVPTVKKEAANV